MSNPVKPLYEGSRNRRAYEMRSTMQYKVPREHLRSSFSRMKWLSMNQRLNAIGSIKTWQEKVADWINRGSFCWITILWVLWKKSTTSSGKWKAGIDFQTDFLYISRDIIYDNAHFCFTMRFWLRTMRLRWKPLSLEIQTKHSTRHYVCAGGSR